MDEVFPLPALLTTKQFSSSETIERLCCLSNGYFRQWSKNSLCVSSRNVMIPSFMLFYKSIDSPKSLINLNMVSDGVILKASSFLTSEYAS